MNTWTTFEQFGRRYHANDRFFMIPIYDTGYLVFYTAGEGALVIRAVRHHSENLPETLMGEAV